MKKIFLMLFAVTLLFACDKDKNKNPEPELSAQVAGNYKVTRLVVDGTSLPLVNASIDLKIDRFAAEVVTGTMTVKVNGEPEPAESIGTIGLKNAGSAGIDLFQGSDKVGNLDKSNKLTFEVQYDGQNYEMVADKL